MVWCLAADVATILSEPISSPLSPQSRIHPATLHIPPTTTMNNLPTEPVGSLPRPAALQAMIEKVDKGECSMEELRKEQDKAVEDSLRRFEATGSPIISDGEQRASSFATYPLADTLGGTGLANNLAPTGGQNFAIFADGHHRQLPRLTGGPFAYQTYAADYLSKARSLTKANMKQAVIAPSMLALLYPLDTQLEGYSREQFYADLVDEAEKDIRKAFAAGATRVSVDFTEGRLALRKDPQNPWTGRGMLQSFIDLNNRVFARFSPAEIQKIAVHTCPGGDCDSTHSADVDYADLLPSLFAMNAGGFLLQLASEKDRERVYKLCGEHSRNSQTVYIGVTNPQNPRVETPEEICREIITASKYIPKERLGTTDDCGFSPFSVDAKPKHGSPDFARDIAFQKIASRVKGTALARAQLFT